MVLSDIKNASYCSLLSDGDIDRGGRLDGGSPTINGDSCDGMLSIDVIIFDPMSFPIYQTILDKVNSISLLVQMPSSYRRLVLGDCLYSTTRRDYAPNQYGSLLLEYFE